LEAYDLIPKVVVSNKFVNNIHQRIFIVPQQTPVTKVKFLPSVSHYRYINTTANEAMSAFVNM
jgi:hypothetical protein